MKIIKLNRFERWYKKLDFTQKSEIDARLVRVLLDGHFGETKRIGQIFEFKFRSGLRVYYGRDGFDLVLLLNGGNKKLQTQDVKHATEIYQEYLNDK